MNGWIHPAIFFFIGAILLPFLKDKTRAIVLLAMPALAFLSLLIFPEGTYGQITLMDMSMTFGRVDRLSLVFCYIFTLIALIGMIYSLHVKNKTEPISAFIYAGSAIGAVFSGDLFTLFLFWEAMAFSSTVIVLMGGNGKAGFRYLLIHLFGGVCLLAGIVIHLSAGNDPSFSSFQDGVTTLEMGLGPMLILLGFLVNAAAPPIHAWLADAYPESSVTGIVFLSAFTTKTAVYVLARGFSGFEPLMWVGAMMTLYGVVYAMLENDTRRLLSYHIISQVGFMVAGIGIGTPLAINGAVAHAFAHILYKAVLMMGMSSVFAMTGRRRATDLGGLYKTMPITFFLFMIGGFSISGVPLFNGFISKSMTISAAMASHHIAIYLILMIASCGTFISTTLKLPYAVFFGEDKKIAASDPPSHMLLAMGLAGGLCVLIGIFPNILYRLLPYPVDYHPFTAGHFIGALEMLSLTAVAFFLLHNKLQPHPHVSVDTDWFYRKGGVLFLRFASGPIAAYEAVVTEVYHRAVIAPMKRFVDRCRLFDVTVIDGMVNGAGDGVFAGSRASSLFEKYIVYGFINITGYANHLGARLFRRLQTGSVHQYAMILIVGIFIFVNVYLILK